MKFSYKKNKRIITAIILSLLVTLTNINHDNLYNNSGAVTVEAANSTVTIITKNKVKYVQYNGKPYKIMKIDGGNTSGKRLANVAVDIGYGSRVYWGLTNKYAQLVYVVADKITLQNPKTEKLLSNDRYYKDEAKVPGTERKDLDEGHIIADSLGGVSNAYNITPQNINLNRYGDQAYMEKVIRDAKGCTNLVATITYPNTKTQIPSHYKFVYTLKGKKITDSFDNVDPDKANQNTSNTTSNNIDNIDTNHNGTVTITEAKAAGYKLPISNDHWLYKYMIDNDHDGMVGE